MSKDTKTNREAERETALILHDVRVSDTLIHVRGRVVQLRGDVFDRESAAGNCIAYPANTEPNLSLLPDPLPLDTYAAPLERKRRELLMASGAVAKAGGLKADEAEADRIHRDALQAGHDKHAAENGIKTAKRGMATPKK